MSFFTEFLHWKKRDKVIRTEPFFQIKLKYFSPKKVEDVKLPPGQHCHMCNKEDAAMGSAFHAGDGAAKFVCLDCAIDNIRYHHGEESYEVAKSRRRRKLDVPYLFQEMFIDRFIKLTGLSGMEDLNEILFKETAVLSSIIYDQVYDTNAKKDRIEEVESQEDIENELEDILNRLGTKEDQNFFALHADKKLYGGEYKSEKLSYVFKIPEAWKVKDDPNKDHMTLIKGDCLLGFSEETRDVGLDWQEYIMAFVGKLKIVGGLVLLVHGNPSKHQIQIQQEGNMALAEFENTIKPNLAVKFFFVKLESGNKVAIVNYIRPKKGFDAAIDEEVVSAIRSIKFIG